MVMIDDPNALPPDDGMGLPGVDQLLDADRPDAIPREPEEQPERRKRLISAWTSRVKNAKSHWDKSFKRMLEDEEFVSGKQWSKNPDDGRYVANLTLRLVAQKTAFLYAKNPKAIARKRERLNATSWDGSQATLQALMQSGAMMMQQAGPMMAQAGPMLAGAMQQPGVGAGIDSAMGGMAAMGGAALPGGGPMQADQTIQGALGNGPMGATPGGGDLGGMIGGAANAAGVPINPMMTQALGSGIDIAMDAARVKNENQMLDKLAKTLELLYEYEIQQQVHPFKSMMKKVVRRTVTCGVGYVKLGFERVMEQRPDMEKGIADASERLATLERLAADQADDVTDEDDKESEQLRLLIEDMARQVDLIVREGLVLDYPLSTNIIPDIKCIELRNFLSADWVAEEFILSTNEIEEIYGVDVRNSYTEYNRADIHGPDPVAMAREWSSGNYTDSKSWDDRDEAFGCIWEIYCRKDGLVYVICDGYDDFLKEPASPEVFNERFFPWYALVFNEVENEKELYPPSDVRLIRDMQMEYNRCREALKEHRIAARPFTATVSGALDEDDLNKLEKRVPNAVIELNALQPNQDIKQLLQPFAGPGIDPNLYEVNPVYEDILRTTGIQEANLGGTSDSTATQAQIAEGSRMTSMGSNVDDLNDMLTQLARNGGQILMREMSAEQVKKVVGVGAVWPELSRQDVANEVLLEIEAGSMGRPNAAQEVANAQRLYPLLIQLPGIDPEFLAKDLLRRLDDRLDLTQAFKSALPSIIAMNGAAQGAAGAGAPAGAAQGPQGANNSPQGPQAPTGGPPDQTQQLTGTGPPGMSAAPQTLQ